MMPTQRSVVAKLRNRSLDGGWSEDSLWRAIRIKVFPRKAVIDIKMFSAERTINWLCIPPINSGEQTSSKYDFCFSSSVRFVFGILFSRRDQMRWLSFNIKFRIDVHSNETYVLKIGPRSGAWLRFFISNCLDIDLYSKKDKTTGFASVSGNVREMRFISSRDHVC